MGAKSDYILMALGDDVGLDLRIVTDFDRVAIVYIYILNRNGLQILGYSFYFSFSYFLTRHRLHPPIRSHIKLLREYFIVQHAR